MNWIIAIIGIIILVYDGILAFKDETTISQWCQRLFPRSIDWAIGIGGWIVLCIIKYYWPVLDFTLGVFLAGFWGHIWIANKERYGD